MCISVELYEIVQLRSGDGVALTLTVGVVCTYYNTPGENKMETEYHIDIR